MKKIQNSYKKSGVNIPLANKLVKHISIVTKKSVKKLTKVNENADHTYSPYPSIKNKFSIIIYLTLYF